MPRIAKYAKPLDNGGLLTPVVSPNANAPALAGDWLINGQSFRAVGYQDKRGYVGKLMPYPTPFAHE